MESQFMTNPNMAGCTDKSTEKGFFDKAKEHKKEIAIGAIILLSVVTAVLIVKNRDAIYSTMRSSKIEGILTNNIDIRNRAGSLISESVEKSITSNLGLSDINVREHIRNLPEGWHPSVSKLELAEKCGYILDEHQTLVNAYTRAAA